ncbi:hypothetical protein MA16_Dca028457 [Dendrobium catenatum]|uniref:Uncharacterized protein n=1 Tax=Dendrobium catenatum TaxID=906689 RepID=A0A2I0VAT2_9ASPA|nr:hypothetical protein MA16_Dca028457 [Dendrobium catenatum]
MKSFINICSSTDVVNSHVYHHHPSEPRHDFPVPEPRFAEHKIHIRRSGGVFTAPKACFSPNGKQHNVQIIVKESEEGGILRLHIDGKKEFEVGTRRGFRGNAELYVDGMAVHFCWDLIQCPMKFSFRTKVGGEDTTRWSEIYEESSNRREAGFYSLLMFGMV